MSNKTSEISIDEKKRIVDFGLLEDDEAEFLENLVIVESLLRRLTNDGQDRSIDLDLDLQDACHRGADMLYDAYKLLRERMLQFATKEAIELGNLEPTE